MRSVARASWAGSGFYAVRCRRESPVPKKLSGVCRVVHVVFNNWHVGSQAIELPSSVTGDWGAWPPPRTPGSAVPRTTIRAGVACCAPFPVLHSTGVHRITLKNLDDFEKGASRAKPCKGEPCQGRLANGSLVWEALQTGALEREPCGPMLFRREAEPCEGDLAMDALQNGLGALQRGPRQGGLAKRSVAKGTLPGTPCKTEPCQRGLQTGALQREP